MGGVHPTAGCAGPVCHVDVRVENCRVIVESQTPVQRGSRDVRMIWTLVTGNAQFASNGIDVLSPGTEIHGKLHGPRHYKWENRNSGPNRFKYNVNVIQDGRPCPSHDPFIVNL